MSPLTKLKHLHEFYLYGKFGTTEIARYCGVNRRTVQRWLAGENKPKKRELEKIREYLKEKGEWRKATTHSPSKALSQGKTTNDTPESAGEQAQEEEI